MLEYEIKIEEIAQTHYLRIFGNFRTWRAPNCAKLISQTCLFCCCQLFDLLTICIQLNCCIFFQIV